MGSQRWVLRVEKSSPAYIIATERSLMVLSNAYLLRLSQAEKLVENFLPYWKTCKTKNCPLFLRELRDLLLLYEKPYYLELFCLLSLALPLLAFSGFKAKALKPHHAVCSMMLYYVNCSPTSKRCTPCHSLTHLSPHKAHSAG